MSFASVATYNAMSLTFSEDLEPLQILNLQGVDVLGRQVVRIVGKHFPAPAIDVEKLKVFVLHKLHRELKPGPYVIVYFHTAVQRNDNSPGLWALRDLYEILPKQLKHGLQAVYVVHPGLRFRLFLGTLGRFFLSEGFHSKLVYISRLEFLTEHVRKSQVEIPEFVIDHDRELETRPLMDYGVEVDLTQNNSMPVGEYPRSPYRDGNGLKPINKGNPEARHSNSGKRIISPQSEHLPVVYSKIS